MTDVSAGAVGVGACRFGDPRPQRPGLDARPGGGDGGLTAAADRFGLRFTSQHNASKARWKLEVRDDATPAQKRHLETLLTSTGKRRRTN